VASLGGEFASAFGSERTVTLLGLLHDVGKALPAFQGYLDRIEAGGQEVRGPQHSIWGAALAYCLIFKLQGDAERWKELCLPIAGHHGGLAAAGALGQTLEDFVSSNSAGLASLTAVLRKAGILQGLSLEGFPRRGSSREFFIRMLLSALADADYLATEEHFKPKKADARGNWPTVSDLWPSFLTNQSNLMEEAAKKPTPVGRIQSEVYQRCIAAAASAKGFFRLTVPTGGGKTRSSLAFGLQHCMTHPGLRRVIFAVPYTSITDQTAREYRRILGDGAILEHHSQMAEPEQSETESQTARAVRQRLSAENWDAPIIVTTTVQLFESMFAKRPGKIRKLHNIADSVIVLDEHQTLPVELLETALDGLRTLVLEYGCTVVLCSATQPRYERIPHLSHLGLDAQEIVPEYPRHFEVLRSRVGYNLRGGPLSWKDLAAELRDLRQAQALVVLNSRRDAMALLDAMGDAKDVVHLSTLLCGAHRREVLSKIESRLKDGEDIRAICTQVVECGVDIDFPVVYRAMGPLDRIVQVAGRCNRKGTRPDAGRVIIFEPLDGAMPRGTYLAGTIETKFLLGRGGPSALHNPNFCAEYFDRLFANADLEKRGIQALRVALDYPETADRFHFIEPTVSAVVPYGDSEAKLRQWQAFPSRDAWRALQPFVVNLFSWQAENFAKEGFLDPLDKDFYRWLGRYDQVRGIVPGALDPSDLIF
jgi:CRISPR-associated endonuclease/helicase Cas3